MKTIYEYAAAKSAYECLVDMYKRHGGPGRGQGRKPEVEGEPMINFSIRMTHGQRESLVKLGGAKWVRRMIDEHGEIIKS